MKNDFSQIDLSGPISAKKFLDLNFLQQHIHEVGILHMPSVILLDMSQVKSLNANDVMATMPTLLQAKQANIHIVFHSLSRENLLLFDILKINQIFEVLSYKLVDFSLSAG